MNDLIEKNILIDKCTAFFVCDLQEKFRPAIDHFNEIVQVAQRLVSVLFFNYSLTRFDAHYV
jgi:hypothetical protein